MTMRLPRPRHGDPFETTAELREHAAGRALELPFAAFRDQVLPFVDPEVAELYSDPASWEQIRGYVVERLLENR